jgi:hypothetical protein
LSKVIETQWKDRERLKKAGTICPAVFHRHGEPIKNFRKAGATACEAAGYPGRLLSMTSAGRPYGTS